MIKFYFSLFFLLQLQLFASAQNKRSNLLDDPFDLKYREIGGVLVMNYDGEKLKMHLKVDLPDTSRFARQLMEDKHEKRGYRSSIGKIRIGKDDNHISLSSNRIMYEVHNHVVQFRIYFYDIQFTTNRPLGINVLMIEFSPDSAVFTCTGNEYIHKVQPAPESFTRKEVKWTATDTNRQKRHCEYAAGIISQSAGAFDLSRFSLQQKNEQLQAHWEGIVKKLLIVMSFWYLWFLLVKYRNYLEKADAKLLNSVIRWMPWMTGYYFVFILNSFVAAMAKEGAKGKTLYWRIGLTVTATALLVLQAYWRRQSKVTRILLVKKILRTFAFSTLVFVLLDAIIQLVDQLPGNNNPFKGVSRSLELEVSANYAVYAICLVYLFISFVFFKLFSFSRFLQVVTISLTLFFSLFEYYPVLCEAEMKQFDNGISFSYPIKRLSETSNGSLDLGMCLDSLCYRFSIIPLLLIVCCMLRFRRIKDEQKFAVIMLSFFPLIFSCLTGLLHTFLLVPITLVIAILFTRYILAGSLGERLKISHIGKRLYVLEVKDKSIFRNMPELRQSLKLKGTYRQRLLNGDLMPVEYEKAISGLDRLIGGSNAEIIRRRMEFGPFAQDLRNGLSGMGYAAVISLFVYLLYLKPYLSGAPFALPYLPSLIMGEQTSIWIYYLSPIIMNCLAGFFLGYYLPFLKGATGWEKGVEMGGAIALAQFPFLYLTHEMHQLLSAMMVLSMDAFILFLTGFLAFDLVTIRKIFGKKVSWREVVDIMGLKKAVTLGTFLLAAAGAGVSAWISGNVQDFISSLLGSR